MVDIHIDGACLGNSRNTFSPGGVGVVVVVGYNHKDDCVTTYKEHIGNSTSSRAELIALIRALNLVESFQCKVTIHTDSRYVVDGYNEWMHAWAASRWKRRNGKPVENKDLWSEVFDAPRTTELSVEWEKGHANNVYNEMANKLARSAAAEGSSEPLYASDCTLIDSGNPLTGS